MKRTFIKMLPIVAAVLLATSCSKDGNDDSNVVIDNPVETQNVASPDNDGVTIVPLTITVNKDGNSLSKATVDVTPGEDGKNIYTQKFVAGDVLIIYNSDVLQSEATFTLKSGDAGKETATFEGSLSVMNGVTLEKGKTKLNAILGTKDEDGTWKNDGYGIGVDADGKPYVKTAETLAEAFETYGRLTAENFTYNGNETSISLTQETVFLRVKPFYGTTTATINGKPYTAQSDGVIYLAVASGTPIESNLFSGTKIVTNANGKVVKNIDRSDCIAGVFSVSATEKVHFSKGNLQYSASASPQWRFADNQYYYIGGSEEGMGGNVEGSVNTNLTGPWIDLFGWVGASSTWTDAAMYGVTTSEDANQANGYGTGTESLKSDWGKVFGDDSPWRTLTGGADGEWKYLLDTRGGEGKVRYAKAQVAGVNGLIIVPDDWKNEIPYNLASCNTANAAYTSNVISSDSWDSWESAGAVFLPAAGQRAGSSVSYAGSRGYYWSSTAPNPSGAFDVLFYSDNLNPKDGNYRYRGFSVRLVRGL